MSDFTTAHIRDAAAIFGTNRSLFKGTAPMATGSRSVFIFSDEEECRRIITEFKAGRIIGPWIDYATAYFSLKSQARPINPATNQPVNG